MYRLIAALVVVLAACDPVPAEPLFCDPETGIPECTLGRRETWRVFCAGGWDPDRPGENLPGSTFASCDGETNELYCVSGATPRCEQDPSVGDGGN